jgi:hypothetical protein
MCCGVIPKQAQSVYIWIHLIIYTALNPHGPKIDLTKDVVIDVGDMKNNLQVKG